MKPIHLILAHNLKSLREQRKLSLDKVAELTGISKTMLGQIERGESSPSITTVWKIANGLKLSFTSLIHEPYSNTVVVSRDDVQALIEDNGMEGFGFIRISLLRTDGALRCIPSKWTRAVILPPSPISRVLRSLSPYSKENLRCASITKNIQWAMVKRFDSQQTSPMFTTIPAIP